MRENIATDEGRELGRELARLCDGEAARQGRDGRCNTCAFRAGDHLANGSVETLMTAFKCAAEREPFWCHEHDRPCAGWTLMRFGDAVEMPWDAVGGADNLAQGMSTGTAKTPKAVEGEACQPGPKDAPNPSLYTNETETMARPAESYCLGQAA